METVFQNEMLLETDGRGYAVIIGRGRKGGIYQ